MNSARYAIAGALLAALLLLFALFDYRAKRHLEERQAHYRQEVRFATLFAPLHKRWNDPARLSRITRKLRRFPELSLRKRGRTLRIEGDGFSGERLAELFHLLCDAPVLISRCRISHTSPESVSLMMELR